MSIDIGYSGNRSASDAGQMLLHDGSNMPSEDRMVLSIEMNAVERSRLYHSSCIQVKSSAE